MKHLLTSFRSGSWKAWIYLSGNQIKVRFLSVFSLPLLIFLLAGISPMNAQKIERNDQISVINDWLGTEKVYDDPCDIEKGWWKPQYLKLKSGIEDGDTIHLESCQNPWGISASDLVYYTELKYLKFCRTPEICSIRLFHDSYCSNRAVRLKTFCYRETLSEYAPEDMYQLWRYEYIICDDYCGRNYKLTYYLAMYDHGAPVYQCFPRDTTVATLANLPAVSEKVNIIDVCQYIAWWNVETEAVVDSISGDTTCFVRTWSAGDPSGNESSQSQKIWIKSDTVNQNLAIHELNSRSFSSVSDFQVYPNPSRNVVYVNIRSDDNLHYTVFDALGRSVKNGNYVRGQSINLNNLKAGVYHLQLRNQKVILATKKVLLIE